MKRHCAEAIRMNKEASFSPFSQSVLPLSFWQVFIHIQLFSFLSPFFSSLSSLPIFLFFFPSLCFHLSPSVSLSLAFSFFFFSSHFNFFTLHSLPHMLSQLFPLLSISFCIPTQVYILLSLVQHNLSENSK